MPDYQQRYYSLYDYCLLGLEQVKKLMGSTTLVKEQVTLNYKGHLHIKTMTKFVHKNISYACN